MTEYSIIGFSGKIGVGKDYIANHIFLKQLSTIWEEKFNSNKIQYLFISFADPLKLICGLENNLEYNELYQNKTTKSRRSLQTIGEKYRKKYGKNCFVKCLEISIKTHCERSNINLFLIPDVRYIEEFNFIKKHNGIIIRINAPRRNLQKLKKETKGNQSEINKIRNHNSEIALDGFSIKNKLSTSNNSKLEFDYEIKNDEEFNSEKQVSIIINELFNIQFFKC